MDAETRHQLKTNELSEALQSLGRLNDTRLTYLLIGILIVLAGWSVYRYIQSSHEQAVAAAWTTIMQSVPDNDTSARQALLRLAQQPPSPVVATVAELKLALADWRNARKTKDANGIEQAAKQLLEIAENKAVPAEYRASAMYAVAAAREDQGNFDDARAMYSRLLANPEFDGSPFKQLADNEVRLLDERMEPVNLLPGMPEVKIEDVLPLDEPPATQPATTQPTEGEASQPANNTTAAEPADQSGDRDMNGDGGETAEPAPPTSAPADDAAQPEEPETPSP